jgi:capsular polysaccharide transport system permease protein
MNNSITREGKFRSSLQMQFRVIRALILREIITRYGRHNIGFLWLMLEPISFTIGVVVLWSLTHRGHGFQVEITPFVVTGYSNLLLWRTCSFRGLKAIEPNRSLLHHRQVTIQDIFISRMSLELAGVTASFVFLMISMITLGLIDRPNNSCLILCGWLLMCWFAACLGTILGCLSEISESVEKLWHPMSYFLLAVSGTFFMVEWLPKAVQDIVLWVPMIHPNEMMRSGYWGLKVKVHYDLKYMVTVCFTSTFVALLLMCNRKVKSPT